MRIELSTLGGLSVRVDGRETPRFSSQPVRSALLVYLAIAGDTTRDAAIALLWPDSDTPEARHALSQTLYELKRTLGDGWLAAQGERLRVTPAVSVDAVRLEGLIAEGDLATAVGLYGGAFLEGWHLAASKEFRQWVDGERERLAAVYRQACREHADELVAEGDRASALKVARGWAAQEPLEADPHHLLVSLLLGAEDPRGALREYRRYERRLEREDLELLPETRDLLGRIQLRLAAGIPTRENGVPEASGSRSADRHHEAYELYLKGRQHGNHRSRESLETAADLFQRAVLIQPDFARAYAGLAEVYAVYPGFTGAQPREWFPKALHAAQRALELEADLPEAHAAMAFPLMHTWKLHDAERHLTRCLELAPSYAPAWVRMGYLLCALGRFREARLAAERALALDPLSVATNFDTGYQFWQLRDRETALRQFRRVQELDPGFEPAHFFIGADHLAEGQAETARREWSRLEGMGPLWEPVVARLDRPEEAAKALDRMTELAPGPVHYLIVAASYTLFGTSERALYWLEGHARNVTGEPGRLETGGPSLTHIVRDPLFDPLRGHDRFKALMRRMNIAG